MVGLVSSWLNCCSMVLIAALSPANLISISPRIDLRNLSLRSRPVFRETGSSPKQQLLFQFQKGNIIVLLSHLTLFSSWLILRLASRCSNGEKTDPFLLAMLFRSHDLHSFLHNLLFRHIDKARISHRTNPRITGATGHFVG